MTAGGPWRTATIFRIRLGSELVPFLLERLLDFQVVFDDAVVHHDDRAAAVAMWVGVFLRGRAVRGPARVADAVSPVNGIQPNDLFQIAQLAGGAADLELPFANHRQARRVVAAILQPLQAFEQHRHHALASDVSDDSRHGGLFPGEPSGQAASRLRTAPTLEKHAIIADCAHLAGE
jgi:hypothetical protein